MAYSYTAAYPPRSTPTIYADSSLANNQANSTSGTFSPAQGKRRMLSREITPPDTDRTVTNRIRCPTPLSESFAAQMNLTPAKIAEIRQQEQKQCEFIQFVNQFYPSYVSTGALQPKDNKVFHAVGEQEKAMSLAQTDALISQFEEFQKFG
ncbi:hypothetical protein BDV3_006053 [Batrachochytrium dendrobatidis]